MNDNISSLQIDSAIAAGDSLRTALCWVNEYPEDVVVLSHSLLNHGITLFQSGRKDEAEETLRGVLYLTPGHPQASQALSHILFLKGVEQAQSGESDNAIATLREVLHLQNDHIDAIRALGITLLNQAIEYFHNGCLDLTEAMSREVLNLLPEHPMATRALVQTLIKKSADHWQKGRLSDASSLLREALYLAPDNDEVLFQLSRIAFDAGKTEEAVSLARRLLKSSPDNVNYVGWACIVLNALGDVNGTENLAGHCLDLVSLGNQATVVNSNEILRIYGEILINKQEFDQAIAKFLELAQSGFHQTVCATVVADALLAKGEVEQALNIISPFACSVWSRTFVTASFARFRDTLDKMGKELLPRQQSHYPGKSISISSISNYGRFGQQMSEYLLLYLYARKNSLVLETPEWLGHYFFELDEPIQRPYRHIVRKGQRECLRRNMLAGKGEVLVNIDIWSPGGTWDDWLPGAPLLFIEDRNIVQARMRVRPLWLPYLQPALDKLNAAGKTIIAIHLRRGDRVTMSDITRTSIYQDWLARIWPTLESPVLFLASDEIDSVKNDFIEYRPFSLSDLAEPWKNNEYLQDFFILMHCDILGISTGGFAANAAMLNQRASLFVCPSSDGQVIVPFLPYVDRLPT